jgi:transposase
MRLYLFSCILSYSRYGYIEFAVDIRKQALVKMHVNAFRYTGGIPSEILFDNMKQVVLDRKIKGGESTFNPEFQQFSQYYAFNVRLCYPYRLETKGKVKRRIGYVRNNFFVGRSFSSLQDLNAQAIAWNGEVNARINGTTGRTPEDMRKEEPLVRWTPFRNTISRSTGREKYPANATCITWATGTRSTGSTQAGMQS